MNDEVCSTELPGVELSDTTGVDSSNFAGYTTINFI
jgi:hypothetical protein